MTDVAVQTLPVRPEALADIPAIEALILRAFGPGRFAKTAERLREGGTIAAGFVVRDEDGRLIGSVRLWSITVGGKPALFLGPIAVDADNRRGGLGADLVQACIDYAAQTGVGVLLVGDPPYFSRFGFVAAPDAVLPGPVDRRRVMWRGAGAPFGVVAIA
ncbi:MAG: N-acetyltransferase [Brevundimonas sp.]|nr:N-acetyltransferase [Brevundimonas sp.]